MLLNFGQPVNGVIQHAFVVDDLDASIAAFSGTVGAGPWFVIDRWMGEKAVYRGQPSEAAIRVAMGFSGHILYELMQPLDDKPSVYKELLDTTGPGFHHFGQGSQDYDAEIARYRAKGYELAFEAHVAPGAGRVGYMDARKDIGAFIEVIENDAAMEANFGRFYAAAVGWDGSDPVRPFF
jgi:hypothetical protein